MLTCLCWLTSRVFHIEGFIDSVLCCSLFPILFLFDIGTCRLYYRLPVYKKKKQEKTFTVTPDAILCTDWIPQ